jgi:hypothetical protein
MTWFAGFQGLDPIFQIAMIADAIGWIALLLFPGKRAANWLVANVIIPMILLAVCLYCVFTNPAPLYLHFTSFPGTVQTLCAPNHRNILMDAWSHILMADLVVGAWMTRRSVALALPRLPRAIVLIVTYLFSPGGLALFFLLAAWKGKFNQIVE